MKIHAIQTGRVQIKAAHVRARREDRADRLRDVLDDLEWVDPLPILCWVIERSEGVIVVDTGETHLANEPGYLSEGHPFFGTCERRWLAPDDEIGYPSHTNRRQPHQGARAEHRLRSTTRAA